MVKLDILSDPVCPWCYIGKASLDRALEGRPDHPFTLEWHPFQLNPDMPKEGMDRRDYLEAKFGGPARVDAAESRINEHAARVGLEIDWRGVPRVPNTLDAHRLIHWAGIEGRQTPVVAALFRAYWREKRDIGDAATLAEIAGEAGLDAGMVRALLAGEADAADIAARDAHSRQRGVSGVPTFVIAGQHVVSGAQPAELWTRVIDDIAGQLARAPA
jgi:predicted DsbA family dithiol-disulfide isomerase